MVAETMQVIRAHGPKDYRLEEIAVPTPGPGEVLVSVDACGICASDMKCWLGGELFWGPDGRAATLIRRWWLGMSSPDMWWRWVRARPSCTMCRWATASLLSRSFRAGNVASVAMANIGCARCTLSSDSRDG